MGFSLTMLKELRNNPTLRKELFALKQSTAVKEGLQPTARAKRIVRDLNRNERRVLDSAEARRAFDQTVKPECRPYQPTEDLFNRGYLEEEAFVNDLHNANCLSVRDYYESMGFDPETKNLYYYLDGDNNLFTTIRHYASKISDYISEMRNIRTLQGEVPGSISTEGLTIKVPKPKK